MGHGPIGDELVDQDGHPGLKAAPQEVDDIPVVDLGQDGDLVDEVLDLVLSYLVRPFYGHDHIV